MNYNKCSYYIEIMSPDVSFGRRMLFYGRANEKKECRKVIQNTVSVVKMSEATVRSIIRD